MAHIEGKDVLPFEVPCKGVGQYRVGTPRWLERLGDLIQWTRGSAQVLIYNP